MIKWSMRAFWSAAGNALSPTQSGWAFHPPVQLTNTTQRLSKNSIWLRPDHVWKSEGMREAVRKRKQRHEISSVSSTHLLYITAKPHSDIWPHSTCCSLCSLTVSLSFTPCTIIYFCTIFVFYLSITLDIWGSYSLVKEAFADMTVKNYFLWTCPKPETPKILLRL